MHGIIYVPTYLHRTPLTAPTPQRSAAYKTGTEKLELSPIFISNLFSGEETGHFKYISANPGLGENVTSFKQKLLFIQVCSFSFVRLLLFVYIC
jgi:hypothetical protein